MRASVPVEPLIFSLATGMGRAAVSMIRLSGAECAAVVTNLCGSLPPPRRASLRTLVDGDGEVLDKAVVVFMPGPASYTGEDVAELHLHGGRAVLDAVSQSLRAAGARLAEPGEFTRRAFLNSRMDLLAAEGIADLVAAETAGQRRQALRQMDGTTSRVVCDWAERVRSLLARQEALIDFPDEGLTDQSEHSIQEAVALIANEMQAMADHSAHAVNLRRGITVAIVGAPNVGKSSLMNVLAGRDVAIVSQVAGTTRDTLESLIELAGVPVLLIDTAGLRETSNDVEAEGVRRARAAAENADIVINVTSPGRADSPGDDLPAGAFHRLEVANKIDLCPAPPDKHGVSAKTLVGVDQLRTKLAELVRQLSYVVGHPVLTRARHLDALSDACEALLRARNATLPELCGEDLRLGLAALGRITGVVSVEDILDTIFSSFCIGK